MSRVGVHSSNFFLNCRVIGGSWRFNIFQQVCSHPAFASATYFSLGTPTRMKRSRATCIGTFTATWSRSPEPRALAKTKWVTWNVAELSWLIYRDSYFTYVIICVIMCIWWFIMMILIYPYFNIAILCKFVLINLTWLRDGESPWCDSRKWARLGILNLVFTESLSI